MKKIILLVSLMASSVTWALPKAPFDALKTNLKVNPKFAMAYNFEGIVKLSNCSGSLVIFNGQPMTSNAIVMTNGHCIQKPGGFLNPGEVWVNRPISRTMKIYDGNMKLTTVQASKILYATMTNTDVAFYELTQTYDDIKKNTKIMPLTLDTTHPVVGEEIEIISGYWDRGYSCAIDGFVFKLKEYNWTWTNSIRYTDGCDTIGGTSGSPIIAKGERRVIGINNTHNEKGERCTMNNPCEVSEQGEVEVKYNVRYGQQTYNIHTCLTPDFRFDLSLAQCELPHSGLVKLNR